MKTGDQITILKPVSPHIEGNGTITKVDEGVLKYEVEQWDIKQWYEETQITDRLIKVEPAPEFPKNICDQYKEAISEATEDIKERSKKEVEGMFSQKTYPTDQKKSAEMFELIADVYSRQSMCNTTFPNGGISSTGAPFIGGSIVGEPAIRPDQIYGRPYIPEASANYTKEQSAAMKKGLELLIETKQSEIKEIEELIKKL